MSAHSRLSEPDDSGLHILDQHQGKAILDRQARNHFDVSGDEFIRAWRAGELDKHPDQSAVTYVAMLIPLADDSSTAG